MCLTKQFFKYLLNVFKNMCLDDLRKKRARLDKLIRTTEIEEAKQKGLIVNLIDDLVCEKHPNSKFEGIEIGGAIINPEIKKYVCKDCKYEGHPHTQAYDCPECGIVKGEYTSSPYDNLGPLSGTAGLNYNCRLCGAFLYQTTHTWA